MIYAPKEEFIVTLKNVDDLDQFYIDMENIQGHNLNIPEREIECVDRRLISRNTHYLLTTKEAEQISQDPRVESVSIPFRRLPLIVDQVFGESFAIGEMSIGFDDQPTSVTQSSNNWDKSIAALTGFERNWALYRCSLEDNISNWGDNGNTTISGTVEFDATGKNVDIIICDGCINTSHIDFNTRFVNYNWFQHDAELGITNNPNGPTYLYDVPAEIGGHGTESASCALGTYFGFAKDANLYNLRYDDEYTDRNSLFDYVRIFHKNKTINPLTGIKNPTIINNSWGYVTTGIQNWFFDIRSVSYRGNTITPQSLGNAFVYGGVSGVCSSIGRIAQLSSMAPSSGNRITTGASTATVTAISYVERGTSNLTATTTATTGYAFFGNYKVTLPFNITYLGTTFSDLYINAKGFVTFGTSAQDSITGLGYREGDSPSLPKIMIGSSIMNSTERVWTGVSGTAGSRTYTIRAEQTDDAVALGEIVIGQSNIIWEMTFYEATPTQIDLHIVANAQYRAEFTQAQLNNYGIVTGNDNIFPVSEPSMDADITDAINNGIIFVGAAGNSSKKQDVSGGQDYNNSFISPIVQWSFSPFYYHRGGSPYSSLGVITVGAVSAHVLEPKAEFSDCGPRIDMYAPGENIVSAYYSGNSAITRINGTSFASPHVCGILACALERNPHWSPAQATNYIKGIAKKGKMQSTSGGYTDQTDLQSTSSNFAYYRRERAADGNVYPRNIQSYRPSTGQVYPRTKIVRYGV